jgi:hypothetical protein
MSTRGCRCDPCQVQRSACGNCLPCVPKYMCVLGDYTPDSYDTVRCSRKFAGRIYWDCEFGGWVPIGITRNPAQLEADVTVRVVETEYPPSCQYEVITPQGSIFYDVDDVLTFSYVDSDGAEWSGEIGGAGVFANPLLSCGCESPCYCATCLPSTLCATFGSGICLDGMSGSGLLTWDGEKWAGSIGAYDIDIEIAGCDEGCFARVHVSGAGTGEGAWAWESPRPADCSPPTHYKCNESATADAIGATTFRRGGASTCQGEKFVTTWLESDVGVYDDYGELLGTLHLRDASCGEPCDVTTDALCGGGCGDLTLPSASCVPPTLVATVFSASCEFSYSMGVPQFLPGGPTIGDQCNWADTTPGCQQYTTYQDGQVGTVPLANGFTLVITLYYEEVNCADSDSHPERYRIRWSIHRPCFSEPGHPACITGDTGVSNVPTCSPLELEFDIGLTWRDLRSTAPHCAYTPVPCDSEDESITVRITR